ncbi:hypothetical protein [Streptomyces qinglanensis]|uniref:Uncharacterized protein n=1 Tax=Streptomyces qinglanensis TaxID=943816 RepID=A0A1H9V9Y0_9ACTN|nr:hypothetical protein [Streptomyces qinglanensis]SES18037.1 hypothetical protein SAMN05421870_1119 [Streptomyces qinglanensis]
MNGTGTELGAQSSQSPRAPVVLHIAALIAGVVLITTGKATPTEAALYVTPFLALYARR